MTQRAVGTPRRGRRWAGAFALEIGLMAAIGALGALVLLPMHWGLAALELAATAVAPLWMMLRVCPHCTIQGSELCPSGFGVISERLAARRDPKLFAQAFAHNVYGVMPVWFLPVAGAAWMAWRGIDVPLVPLVLFAVLAFVATPLRARFHHCKRCPRRGDCPWAVRALGMPPTGKDGSVARGGGAVRDGDVTGDGSAKKEGLGIPPDGVR